MTTRPNIVGIQIGASPEAIKAARDAILRAGRDDQTTRNALDAFTSVTQVNGATVSDSTITVGGAK